MAKLTLTLHPSEAVVVRAAATIYAAYVTAGLVKDGGEKEWMKRALDEALWMARAADEMIHSDNEMG
jgi:hypothetical protein